MIALGFPPTNEVWSYDLVGTDGKVVLDLVCELEEVGEHVASRPHRHLHWSWAVLLVFCRQCIVARGHPGISSVAVVPVPTGGTKDPVPATLGSLKCPNGHQVELFADVWHSQGMCPSCGEFGSALIERQTTRVKCWSCKQSNPVKHDPG